MKLWKRICIVAALIALPGFKILQNSESRAAIRMGKVSEFWNLHALTHFPPPGPVGLFLTGLIPAFVAYVVLPAVRLFRSYRSG